MPKPVILLAFGTARDDRPRILRNLPVERHRLRAVEQAIRLARIATVFLANNLHSVSGRMAISERVMSR